MSNEEIRPWLKLIFWPIVFLIWAVYRMTHTTYVSSPSFLEYWKSL